MKKCSKCEKVYDDTTEICSCGQPLSLIVTPERINEEKVQYSGSLESNDDDPIDPKYRKYPTILLVLFIIRFIPLCMLCACENPVIQWRTFYVTLRWIVCMSAIVNAWLGLRMSNLPYTNKSVWRIFMIVFGIITLLFNPIIPVHLSRDIWEWIDVFTAVIFFLSLFFLPDKDLYTKK